MEIGVAGPILTHKNIKGTMGKEYLCSTRWGKNIVINLHNYGARSIFLLFCDHTDTESESREIEMSISQPIFNHTNKSKSLWDNAINNVQDGRKML